MGALNIYIMEAQWCPLCGKPLFGKKYLEKVKESESDGLEEPKIYNYRCKRCGSLITINTNKEVKPNSSQD